jgi:osmotically-inducible protein OsmY
MVNLTNALGASRLQPLAKRRKSMKAPQLFCVIALATTVGACQNRGSQAELKQSAGETADRIRTEGVKAGEKLGDAWLAAKINAKFVGDRDIKARNIKVLADNGRVTLQGHVLNESEHQLALTLARNTDGVKQVIDNLDVLVAGPPPPSAVNGATPGAAATSGTAPLTSTLPSSATSSSPASPIASPDDARITTSIQSKYFMDDRIKGRHINVTTTSGVVTLHGEIADDTERAEALLLARTTEGVKRVEDNLTVSTTPAPTGASAAPATSIEGPSAPPAATAAAPSITQKPAAAVPDADSALADRIRSQLTSDTQVKNASLGSLDVTAKGGVVQLQGTVPTSAAKQRALALARNTDGVTQVVDRIEVSTPKSSPPKTTTGRKAKK